MSDIVIIAILIAVNAFFSLSEVALISARKSRLDAQARQGNRSAAAALKLTKDPNCFLSTIQVGITVISILTGIFSSNEFAVSFGELLATLGIGSNYAYLAAQAIIVVVVTYLSCELGELVPKRIGLGRAEAMAKFTAPAMLLFFYMTRPIVWLLSKNTDLVMRILHLDKEERGITEEEIKSIIQEGTDAGEVQEVEQDIMERALALGDQTVEQLMTHRSDITFLDMDMTAQEIEKIITEDTHAAYPVIGDDPDEVMGIITVKDLIPRL